MTKKFKNDLSIEQISLACRHVEEMKNAGVTENMSIRTLELFVDTYAKVRSGGSPTPHHINQVKIWSVQALKIKKSFPDGKPKDFFRVEHGTPRRALARKVLSLYGNDKLTSKSLDALVKRYWKLAVITIDEDIRLNKIARSKVFSSPDERWAAAGIEIVYLE